LAISVTTAGVKVVAMKNLQHQPSVFVVIRFGAIRPAPGSAGQWAEFRQGS
jgi:hypothetical protein